MVDSTEGIDLVRRQSIQTCAAVTQALLPARARDWFAAENDAFGFSARFSMSSLAYWHRELIPYMLGGGHPFGNETGSANIASRKGYGIESVPMATVYTDQISEMRPAGDPLRFFKLMRRYKASRV